MSMRARELQHEVKGQGEPLVLVPGGLSGWVSWVPHAERLSERRRTIRVQPIHNELGSAGEPGDPDYTTDTERDSLRMTLDALGIESADFAGWSGGGRALIEFALAYPERVRTLTLIEPAAYWLLEELGEADPEVEHVNSFLHGLAGREVSEDDLAEFLRLAGFLRPGEDARENPSWERSLPHRMALSWQSEALARSGRTPEDLAAIGQPVLLVRGSDTADWLKRVVGVLAERLPNATLLELPGGHACHLENEDAFLGALERHLAAAAADR